MYLDIHDSLNLKRGYYEPEETALIKQLIRPDWTCLDIGAHIGYFTLLLSKYGKWVETFEPEESNFRLLLKNLSLNKTSNVLQHKKAVTELSGAIINLYLSGDNSGMHRVYPSKWCTEGRQQIETITIDEVVDKADFIKIDIEGAEIDALQGMSRLLTKHHPIILMEFCPKYITEYGADPLQVYHFLKTLGYSIMLLPDKDTPISYEDLERETRKEPTGRNILAV